MDLDVYSLEHELRTSFRIINLYLISIKITRIFRCQQRVARRSYSEVVTKEEQAAKTGASAESKTR